MGRLYPMGGARVAFPGIEELKSMALEARDPGNGDIEGVRSLEVRWIFSGRLASHHLDAARAATRHHLEAVPMTPAGLAHLDLHPHGVAEVVRRLAAERPRLA